MQSQYEQTEKIIEDLKAQNDDMIAYIAQLDAQMSSVDGELNEVNEQVEQIEAEIADTEEKLAQAEIEAEEQYSSMKLRIQFMYEHNDETYFALLMNSQSMGDMLNKAEYITKISQYDREMLEKYNATVTYITVAKAQLETDRETLVTKQEVMEKQDDEHHADVHGEVYYWYIELSLNVGRMLYSHAWQVVWSVHADMVPAAGRGGDRQHHVLPVDTESL